MIRAEPNCYVLREQEIQILFGSKEKMSRYHFLEGFVREGEISEKVPNRNPREEGSVDEAVFRRSLRG